MTLVTAMPLSTSTGLCWSFGRETSEAEVSLLEINAARQNIKRCQALTLPGCEKLMPNRTQVIKGIIYVLGLLGVNVLVSFAAMLAFVLFLSAAIRFLPPCPQFLLYP